MPTLRADENRYLLFAEPWERAKVRRIPGGRWSAARQCWVFAPQAALIGALDRVFGESQWEADETVAVDTAAARQRRQQLPPPKHRAQVTLDGARLAVQCHFDDRDLVKLVPGYRWSQDDRRWFLDAFPLALEILEEVFGAALQVSDEARTYVGLKRQDEERQPAGPSAATGEATARRTGPGAPGGLATGGVAPAEKPLDPPGSLAAAVALLGEAIARIEAKLDALVDGRTAQPGAAEPPAREAAAASEPSAAGAGEVASDSEWRRILEQAASEPRAALDAASRRLQTAADDEPQVRCIAGVAASAAGEHDTALRHLRRSIEEAGIPEDAELRSAVEAAYSRSVLAILEEECSPKRPLADIDTLRSLLLAELASDEGFDDAAIGSQNARATLELLVNDRSLRAVNPEISELCRVAHLLATARAGVRRAQELVTEMLKEPGLSAEGYAFALVLFANVVAGVKCSDEWLRWPEEETLDLASEFPDFAARTLERLASVPPDLATTAALAALTVIAPAHADTATLQERRDLAAMTGSRREYADFLAIYRLAGDGVQVPLERFPGYLKVLARTPLRNSAAHIVEVLYNGSGVKGSAVTPIAETAYLPALQQGVRDPEAEVVELLELLRQSPRSDNLLNELAELVEDDGFVGASSFTRAQQRVVYEAALEESVARSHDEDSRRAFLRLVRLLSDEPETTELRTFCARHLKGFKHLRIAALMVLLELMLEEGADIDGALELADPFLSGRQEDVDLVVSEVTAVAHVFPEHKARIYEYLEGKTRVRQESAAEERDFRGKRIVVVGGHQRMRARATSLMESWGVDVAWLTPEEAKQGSRLPDLVRGACDAVVVNTAYISHAASGRAESEAKAAAKPLIMQPHTGVGMFLRRVWNELSAEGPRKQSKVREKRALLGR